jgi:hypothetical protein
MAKGPAMTSATRKLNHFCTGSGIDCYDGALVAVVFLLEHAHPWSYFLVTPFRIAPSKAYFGYFQYVQVPSDPHRWRYSWDENGRGPVFVLRLLERSSKYVAPRTMQYYVWRRYGQIEQGYFLEW